MPLNLPTFYKRTGSAIVFGAVMLTGLLWKEWAFLVLVCFINALCLRDYFRLIHKIDTVAHQPMWLPFAMQAIGVVIIIPTFFLKKGYTWPIHAWQLLALSPVLLLPAAVLSKKSFLPAMAKYMVGLLYITLPMAMLLFMRMQHIILPLSLILMIWINDTMAYLVGSFIGKHPFSPVSPKKTWEGTIGGAILTIIAAGIYGFLSHAYRWIDWMMLALCATIAGTLGDLLESKLKRMADVKDSGTLMPGHGGALDRFDSLLVATPFAFVYVLYFMC